MAGPAGTILAFDTSAAHCAAAVMRGGVVVAQRHEAMQRGQAERLVPLLAELLAEAGLDWRDLAGLAVGVGPGNFTGVRIAVATARGLALGLGRPALGVSNFELLLDPPMAEELLISLPAPRGQAYVRAFRGGAALGPPLLIDPENSEPALAHMALGPGALVRGHRAQEIAAPLSLRAEPIELDHIAERLARRAAWLFAQGGAVPRPAPLYVTPADAAPASDPPPVILDA